MLKAGRCLDWYRTAVGIAANRRRLFLLQPKVYVQADDAAIETEDGGSNPSGEDTVPEDVQKELEG